AALAAFQLREARGPHWLSENLDPTYPYLLNSLNVSNLHRPFHYHHPGTPVQLAGGVVIRLSHPLSGERELARRVLTEPEHYVGRISTAFVVLYALALLAAGFAALAATRSAALALVFQATPFVSETSVEALTGVRPEPLLSACALLLGAVALLALRFDVKTHARRYALAFGAVVGLGVACKINFAPLAVLPLIMLPRLRARLEFCAGALLSFLFFVALIITPFHLRAFLSFSVSLLTHTGRYGSGAQGFADPQRYFESAARLAAGDWPFFALVAAGLLLPAWALVRRREEGAQIDERDARRAAGYRILFAAAAAEVLQFLLVAKHPSARYLAPALNLAGLNLVLLCELLRPRLALRPAARYALLLALALVAFVQARQLSAQRGRLEQLTREQLATHELSERQARSARVVRYYSSSSPAFALKYGSDYSNNFYGALLQELYPGNYFYDLWTGRFSDFRAALPVTKVAPEGGPFFMHGYSLADTDFLPYLPPRPLPEGLSVEPVHRGDVDRPNHYDGEAVYRATFGRQ
ncbi:MAG TPA: hypothetical protein VGV38_03890, partial [Pyrinomonadaceae bacterium]|nr:hypothetical protein [Pyrinomonadaceae bacterium]